MFAGKEEDGPGWDVDDDDIDLADIDLPASSALAASGKLLRLITAMYSNIKKRSVVQVKVKAITWHPLRPQPSPSHGVTTPNCPLTTFWLVTSSRL